MKDLCFEPNMRYHVLTLHNCLWAYRLNCTFRGNTSARQTAGDLIPRKQPTRVVYISQVFDIGFAFEPR